VQTHQITTASKCYLHDKYKYVSGRVVCVKWEPGVKEKWLAITCKASQDEVEEVSSPIAEI
jgi:hypothetical protein